MYFKRLLNWTQRRCLSHCFWNDIILFYIKHMKYLVYKTVRCLFYKISSLVKFSFFSVIYLQLFIVCDSDLNLWQGNYFVLFIQNCRNEKSRSRNGSKSKITYFYWYFLIRQHFFSIDFLNYRIMFKKLASKECIRSLSLHRSMSTSMSRQSKFTTLSVDDKTGIATLEMNRPPVNSLNTLLLKDISNALDEVVKNRSKGLILTSVKISIFYFFYGNWMSVKSSIIIFSHRQQYFQLV